MQLTAVSRLANSLMREHGLIQQGWTFEFDNGRNRAGACRFGTKRITLSRHLMVNWSENEVRNVILHEIAHAIAGHRAGHGPTWRAHARRIGCTGDRCWTPSEDAPELEARWIRVCPNGHYGRKMHRRTDSVRSCAKCSPGRFDDRYLLRTVPNPAFVG